MTSEQVEAMTPVQVERRMDKLRKRATLIQDEDDLAQILRGFPKADRQRIFDELQSTLGWKTYPSDEAFRIANLSAHEYEAELNAQ